MPFGPDIVSLASVQYPRDAFVTGGEPDVGELGVAGAAGRRARLE